MEIEVLSITKKNQLQVFDHNMYHIKMLGDGMRLVINFFFYSSLLFEDWKLYLCFWNDCISSIK